MTKHSFKAHLLGVMIFLAVIAGFAVAFMFLWNALMPPLFALPVLNYWQAAGLLLFARLLFSGITGGGFRRDKGFHPREREDANALRERWSNMSDEERLAFIEKGRELRGRFFHHCDKHDGEKQ